MFRESKNVLKKTPWVSLSVINPIGPKIRENYTQVNVIPFIYEYGETNNKLNLMFY